MVGVRYKDIMGVLDVAIAKKYLFSWLYKNCD